MRFLVIQRFLFTNLINAGMAKMLMGQSSQVQDRALFVYGAFCPGMPQFHRLQPYIVSEEPGYVLGSVYRLQVGYPTVMLRGDTPVPGVCLTIRASEVLFAFLDEYHGFSPITPEKSLYWKSEVQVHLEDGLRKDASIYSVNPTKLPKTAKLIEDGNWKKVLQENPSLLESLTDRQIMYVKKLGSCNGRDIVPIDLDVYRELMKLELIVDKGRRLALTSLGKEVYRFIG